MNLGYKKFKAAPILFEERPNVYAMSDKEALEYYKDKYGLHHGPGKRKKKKRKK